MSRDDCETAGIVSKGGSAAWIVLVVMVSSWVPVAFGAPPTPEESRRAAEAERQRVKEHIQRQLQLRQQYREKLLCLAGTDTAYSVLAKLYAAFRKDRKDVPMYLDYTGGGDVVGVRKLTSGQAEAALIREKLTDKERELLAKAFPDPDFQPARAEMGRLALIIVTNASNPVSGLTVKQLEDIYRGVTPKWSEINGAVGNIVRIGTAHPQLSRGMFLRRVLKNKRVKLEDLPFRKEGYTEEEYREFHQERREKHRATGGKPFAMLTSDYKVLAEVAKNSAAIGYCIHPVGKALPVGVRWVPIVPEGSKEAVVPTPKNVLLGRYPLQVNIRWLVSPKASDTCYEFIKYVSSKEAIPVLQAGAVFPGRARADLSMAGRLADAKAGKGVRIAAVGCGVEATAMRNLATEYVRAKATVQLSYAALDSDVSAVGAFVTGGAGVRELFLLGDRPSGRAMALHGAKWSALGVGKDGKPDGSGPTEYVIAGRAVAVIVNPANKLESLTLGQIQAIFSGEIDDWSVIGGTELSAPAGPGGRPGKLQIDLFGLRGNNPATTIFEKECLPRQKWRGVTYKKDTVEAVAAVSMDRQAMAFVDVTAIPASGQNIKVLPIKMGSGIRAKSVGPTPETIKTAMYPLSQRLFLYVHPQASETAKDFAKFIATCGDSEASPYADTVKAVMETYRTNGLIPLADAAIVRAIKDAMAEAIAEAKDGK